MHILEDLYTGNVRPGERSYRQNSQYNRALAQAVESGDVLSKSLTEKHFISEVQEKGCIDKISWRNCLPANNRTIQRMVTVASGTFAAIDLTDAAIESALSSGGKSAKLAEGIVLRINFVNIGRFTLGCAVDAASGTRKAGYEFMAIELSTGRLAVTAENIFLRTRKRLEHTKEREKHVALVLGEGISINESTFSIEEAQPAVKEIIENKIHSYEELKNRPWYKKLYALRRLVPKSLTRKHGSTDNSFMRYWENHTGSTYRPDRPTEERRSR